jgi:hypothetical protein
MAVVLNDQTSLAGETFIVTDYWFNTSLNTMIYELIDYRNPNFTKTVIAKQIDKVITF